jgi:hypothetical protein
MTSRKIFEKTGCVRGKLRAGRHWPTVCLTSTQRKTTCQRGLPGFFINALEKITTPFESIMWAQSRPLTLTTSTHLLKMACLLSSMSTTTAQAVSNLKLSSFIALLN